MPSLDRRWSWSVMAVLSTTSCAALTLEDGFPCCCNREERENGHGDQFVEHTCPLSAQISAELKPKKSRPTGETTTIAFAMARRPEPAEFDKPLTKKDLAKRRRELSMPSEHNVRCL
jgi:hypothetical protein